MQIWYLFQSNYIINNSDYESDLIIDKVKDSIYLLLKAFEIDRSWNIISVKISRCYNILARSFVKNNQLDNALENIELSNTYHKSADGFYMKSLILFMKKDIDLSILSINESIKLDDNHVFYEYRGFLYKIMKYYTESLQDYNYAIKMDNNNAEYYNNRGNLYKEMKFYDEALQDYNYAIKMDNNNAEYYNNRGNLYKEMKFYDEALRDYSCAINLNNKDAGYYNNRGNLYIDMRIYEKALQDYSYAVILDGNNAEYYNNRGNVYRNMKRYEEALQDYYKGIYINGNLSSLYYNIAWVYRMMGNVNKALIYYNKSIEYDPKNIGNLLGFGTYCYEINCYDETIELFHKALDINTENSNILNNLAFMYSLIDKYDLSREYYLKALYYNQQYFWAWLGLARLAKESGKTEEIWGNLHEAQKCFQDDRLYEKACFYAVWGDRQQCLDFLERALEQEERSIAWIRQDPAFRDLHDDPTFKSLIK